MFKILNLSRRSIFSAIQSPLTPSQATQGPILNAQTQKTAPNPLRIDPSRTGPLRRAYSADLVGRFVWIGKKIRKLVAERDAFGIEHDLHALLKNSEIIKNDGEDFRFLTDPDKINAFRNWLRLQVRYKFLSPTDGPRGKPWLSKYIDSAYKQGIVRAFIDTNPASLARDPKVYTGGRNQFLRQSFAAPESVRKLEMLYTRNFTALEGITDAMGTRMSETLTNGLAHGHGMKQIARALVKNVKGAGIARAKVLAQTEIIRAHAEGQLDGFEDLGVDELGIMAEFSTAGDNIVCPRCAALSGKVYTIKKARGLIPVHPRCRCTWIPYLKSPKKKRRSKIEN